MVAQVIGMAGVVASGFSAGGARSLGLAIRQELSVEVLAKTRPLTPLAAGHGGSRKFLYQQARQASAALQKAFAGREDEQTVLFHLPVTKNWIRQFVLGLAMEGHSRFRGIHQLAQDLLDYPDLSVETIHNILHDAAAGQARAVNQAQDLAGIRAGAHDEIYQAGQFKVPAVLVQQVCQLEALNADSPAYWHYQGPLLAKLGAKFLPLQQAVRAVMGETTRASSLVENLNSRLRNYFSLRRELGSGYLDLLRFFLNHRRFQRSRCPQRVGRSPAELLNGRSHPHWLELLGFQRFHRN